MLRHCSSVFRISCLLISIMVWTSTARTQEPPSNEQLWAGAQERIAKHRMAPLVIQVRDAAGQPLAGATVNVQQLRHEFLFGCNLFLWGRAGNEADEQTYRDRFSGLFNFATLPFYWPAYEPRKGEPQHGSREAAARWCIEHEITAKGHPLAWNFAESSWLPEDPEEVFRLQLARIDDCVSRFKGLIEVWDVVNEATHYEREEFRRRAPKLTAAWDKAGRVGFILECLKHARAANPGSVLLVNDYRTDPPFEKILKELIEKSGGKPPFDVIGIQSHQHRGTWDNRQIWEVCDRFAQFGLPIHFTETTIVSGAKGLEQPRPWITTPEGETWQADEVERFYTMIFSHPATAALTWWDFSDRSAWQGAPAGFLRKDMSPKPSYDRLLNLIKERWWTHASATTDQNGVVTVQAFRGDHEVKVENAGKTATVQVTVGKDQPNKQTIALP